MCFKFQLRKGLFTVPFLVFTFFSTLLFSSLSLSKSLQEISKHETWQRLLRYERAVITPWKKASAVSDKDFFLSPDGAHDALAELEATLGALNQPFKSEEHTLCKFPARYKWLRKQGVIGNLDKELLKCTKYQKWNENGTIKSISIYFATGYFGNPASFFGHPLIKFNTGKGKPDPFDSSLNYGAMTPENENPVFYVFKGLFGGYSASFTHHDFYYHNHNYSETEMRDLWEYKLNLKPDEVQYVVDRTFELLAKNHPYFFFADNCAYRMGELFGEIFERPLFFRNFLYVIPIDVYKKLATGKRKDGSPLVTDVRVIPSRYTRLAKTYGELSPEENTLVRKTIEHGGKLPREGFDTRDSKSQARITETLINYYSFIKMRDKEDADVETQRLAMIRERFKIKGKSGFKDLDFQEAPPPHETVNSFGLGFTQGHSKLQDGFQELTIRFALYDELNPSIGRPENSSLEVMKTRFRFHESDFSLRSLEVFRVGTTASSTVKLPDMLSMAWRVRAGIEEQFIGCDECLIGYVEGGAGLSHSLNHWSQVYGLLKGGLQSNRNGQGTIKALPEVGIYANLHESWKIFGSYEYERYLNGLEQSTDVWTVESRFGASKSWDLRLAYKNKVDEQIRLSFWLYL